MRLVFLPGSSGRGEFWDPVREQLSDIPSVALDWPGIGGTPPNPQVGSYDDLVAQVTSQLRQPSVLVSQSMGGYIAMRVALAAPTLVSHLVLAVTSAGVGMAAHGALDWRAQALLAGTDEPAWLYEPQPDLEALLPSIDIPVLLLWATRDPISPLSVGERLAALLPHSELVAYDSDDHWVARLHAVDVATRIRRFVHPS